MSSIRNPQRRLRRIAAVCTVTLIATITPVAAQTAPDAIPDADIDDLIDFSIVGDPYTDNDPWVDPAQLAGLDCESRASTSV